MDNESTRRLFVWKELGGLTKELRGRLAERRARERASGFTMFQAASHSDRSRWPPGPWDAEPEDRIEWRSRDYRCLMLRHPLSGTWNAYIAVPLGHSWHGREAEELDDIRVHGGVTYSGRGPDDSWVIGFDMNHAGDATPFFIAEGVVMGVFLGTYRDKSYVRDQVEKLVDQAIIEAMMF